MRPQFARAALRRAPAAVPELIKKLARTPQEGRNEMHCMNWGQ
jgi:hypothetical protein